MRNNNIKFVLWDYGGVLTYSPFSKIQEFEKKNNYTSNSIIKINSKNSYDNAWAKLEKNDIDINEFIERYQQEAKYFGIRKINPAKLLMCLETSLNKNMVNLLIKTSKKYKNACLTNNFKKGILKDNKLNFDSIKNNFYKIFESSQLSMRKPEKEIYIHVINELDVKPEEILFIDDLGINLKPARELGFHTYKMIDEKSTIEYIEKKLRI